MITKYVVSAGVIVKNPKNKILVFYRGDPFNDISFPKGKQENGETLEETAKREVLEETGLKVVLRKKLGISKYEYIWEPTQEYTIKEVHYFLGDAGNDMFAVDLGGKDNILKAEWISLESCKLLVKHKVELDILNNI